MRGKFVFTGTYGPYFWGTFGRALLAAITIGIMAPYVRYFQQRYFLEHTTIELEERIA